MKKTLIALALTALPVAAMADVTLYGQIKGGVNVEQNKVSGNGESNKKFMNGQTTDTVVRDFGSRIGFKGEEDLGNGLKTIWQVEQSVSLGGDTGKGWSNRETFIGLEGNFGKVRVGNLKNVFDSNVNMADDQWEYGNEALGLSVFTRFNDKVGASIKYDTPNFAGFTGALQYRTSANDTEKQRVTDAGNKSKKGSEELYAAVGYENSGFFANYGFGHYAKRYNNDSKAKNAQVHRLEAGYDANNLFVVAAYQYSKGYQADYANALGLEFDKDANGDLTNKVGGVETSEFVGSKRQELALTAAYTMGAITPRVSYAHGWDAKDAAGEKLKNSKYDQVILGADYALSKRTTALVSAGWLRQGLGEVADSKVKLTKSAASVGLKHVF